MQSKYTLMLLNQISALQIFPVPTVDANAVINAENCEISPSCSDLLKIILKAKGSDLNWIKPSWKDKKTWVPINKINNG